jgi:guanylate kinase
MGKGKLRSHTRPTVICLVGGSGTGKTYIANLLEDVWGIPMIESRTTRPPRYKGERGHAFVTQEEFATYKREDMIAFTQFGVHNYCCLHEDVNSPLMSYVLDEFGLLYLQEQFSDRFNIFAIRIFAPEYLRRQHVDKERMDRDKGKFTLDHDHFDSFIENNYDPDETLRKVTYTLQRIKNKFNIDL